MKLHSEADWHPLFTWWVTWNNYSRHLSQQVHMQQFTGGIREMQDFISQRQVSVLIESNRMGRSGFGFKNEYDAMEFYLTFSGYAIFKE